VNIEERLENIEKRLKILEEKEKRRHILEIIKFIVRVIILAATIVLAIFAYRMIKEQIAPYQQIVSEYNDFDWQDIIDTYIQK